LLWRAYFNQSRFKIDLRPINRSISERRKPQNAEMAKRQRLFARRFK
jgi:hypothetical protein